MTHSTELTTQSSEVSLMQIVASAVENNVPAAELNQLMQIQREHERNRAREAYYRALASFQAEVPVIKKNKEADRYMYATYDEIMMKIRPCLSKYGISVQFSTEQMENQLRVRCRIGVGGHAEDHWFQCPVPMMKVNDTQKQGAALSYAKRYALVAALNLIISDEDDDAMNLVDLVTDEQVAAMVEIINAKRIDADKFMHWVSSVVGFQVFELDQIPVSYFNKVYDTLRRR